MNKAVCSKSQNSLNVGWAKERVATCPTLRTQGSKTNSTAWIAQSESKKLSHLNVGHVVPPLPNLRLRTSKYQQGITYIEIILVVIILGIIAAVAMPNLSSTDPVKLDLATQEFANAMRFARSESIRTGKPYGFEQNNESIVVRRIDTSTSPWSSISDVYHPVNKKLYHIDLKDIQSTQGVTVTRNTTYRGNCTFLRRVYFDSHGTPWCLVPENVGLIIFENVLTLGSHSRTVKLHAITGRVTIQ